MTFSFLQKGAQLLMNNLSTCLLKLILERETSLEMYLHFISSLYYYLATLLFTFSNCVSTSAFLLSYFIYVNIDTSVKRLRLM